MQQTEKYQFNLIEGSDKFLPGPLNDNMEKVEGVLADQAAALAGRTLVTPPLREAVLGADSQQFSVNVEGLDLSRYQFVLTDLIPPATFTGKDITVLMRANGSTRYTYTNGSYTSNSDTIYFRPLVPLSEPHARYRVIFATYNDPDAYVASIDLARGTETGSNIRVADWKTLLLYCLDSNKLPAGLRVVFRGIQ